MSSRHPFVDQSIIVPDIARPSAGLINELRDIPATTLHEAAGQKGALPSPIKPFGGHTRMAGPAFTVQAAAGDNLWIHRAISIAEPGDIVIVATQDHYETGYWGEIMSTAGSIGKLGGVVIDGCVRDGELLRSIGFPVYARGLCMRSPQKDLDAQGYLNSPMRIGDVAIQPGDIVVGDTDGVVILPSANLRQIIDAAKGREAKEQVILRRIAAGEKTVDVFGWNKPKAQA